MSPFELLEKYYHSALESGPDVDFYKNVHLYFGHILNTPEYNSLFSHEKEKYSNKYDELTANKELTDDEFGEALRKYESVSFYSYGTTLFHKVYDPMEDYLSSEPGDYFNDEVMIMVKGIDHIKVNNWFKRIISFIPHISLYEKTFIVTLNGISSNRKQITKAWKLRRIYIENKLKRFHILFLKAIYDNQCNGKQLEVVEDIAKDIYFDLDKSVLYFLGQDILISQKVDKTDSHYLLEYLLRDPTEKLYYSDVVPEIYYVKKEKWRKAYRAANMINDKIFKKSKLDNFLIIKTGITGYIQISPEYIDFLRLP